MAMARRKTEEADYQLDDEGNVIDDGGRLADDQDVIIVEDRQADVNGENGEPLENGTLFNGNGATKTRKKKTKKTSRRRSKKHTTRRK